MTGPHAPVCAFCDKPNGEDFVGELLSKGDLHAHYFCMLFSSGLHQRGQDSEPLRGFLDTDVRLELRRGTRLACSFCKKKSATVGCCLKACKKVFHMPCGVTHSCLLQFFGDFRVYCATHRPQQNVVPLDTGGGLLCPICAEEMTHPSVTVLVTPCCRQLFHRTCIQKQALSAGSHFFRCGHCNNQDAFQREMQEHGIYVPERDASWEQEPRAFEELLFHYSHCDAPRCCCPVGRDHSEENSRWKVVVCDGCGSQGVHAACGNVASLSAHWLCSVCRQVISRGSAISTVWASPSSLTRRAFAATSRENITEALLPCSGATTASCREVVPFPRRPPPPGVEIIEIDSSDDEPMYQSPPSRTARKTAPGGGRHMLDLAMHSSRSEESTTLQLMLEAVSGSVLVAVVAPDAATL